MGVVLDFFEQLVSRMSSGLFLPIASESTEPQKQETKSVCFIRAFASCKAVGVRALGFGGSGLWAFGVSVQRAWGPACEQGMRQMWQGHERRPAKLEAVVQMMQILVAE